MDKDNCAIEFYKVKRNFLIWGRLGVCAMTRKECIDKMFQLTCGTFGASVDLLGIPMSVRSMENADFVSMFNNATMTIIDGMPIVKMCRKTGITCERCSGPDIMPNIFERSVIEGKSHYFYGGNSDEVLLRLRQKLEGTYPGIKIAGMFSPPFRTLTEEEDHLVCEEINRLHPDFIWVGIGAPKQELWIQEHRKKIKGGVMVGVGAAFNFFAGTVDKAPQWVEKAGVEWLYRLFKEPKRLWRRYVLGGLKYIYYSLKYKNTVLEKYDEK